MVVNSPVTAVPSQSTQAAKRWRLIGWATVAGGALVMLGAALPWLTFFAGLQAYSGLAGLNGRLLMGGGAIALLAGLRFLHHMSNALRWAIGLFGFVLLAFTGWLVVGLLTEYFQLAHDAMMVPALGPGLFVALGGALFVFAALLIAA